MYSVLWASEDWLNFCGFTDIVGKSLKMLQGPETDADTADAIKFAAMRHEPITATLINYTKSHIPFQHTIHVEVLFKANAEPALFKVTSQDIVSFRDLEDAARMREQFGVRLQAEGGWARLQKKLLLQGSDITDMFLWAR